MGIMEDITDEFFLFEGCRIDAVGNKFWFKNHVWHRDDGPAVELISGYKEWRINGKIHREDGPAQIFSDGLQFWYFNAKKIDCDSQEEFERLIKLKIFW